MGVGGQRHTLAALLPGKRPSTHCIGGWAGPKARLDGFGKSSPYRHSILDRPARSESLYRLSGKYLPNNKNDETKLCRLIAAGLFSTQWPYVSN
jgi:hypothetical protein